tara:strand:- start:18 stop:1427 length:1410 start_codon:yes stop_codon:yes gene_type:complete
MSFYGLILFRNLIRVINFAQKIFKMKHLLSILFLITLFGSVCFSQEQTKNNTTQIVNENVNDTTKKELYLVRKTDGNELYGFILNDDGREILLETKTIGKVYINKSDIKEIINTKKSVSVDAIDNESYTEFRDSGPFTTRYYFTNNALPVKKGEDYAMIHLYGPEIHFSLSDKLSLGVMTTWIASPIALAAKYSLYSKGENHIALGTILGSSGYLGIGDGGVLGGLHWLTFTKGDRLSNISFSAGYGYFKDNGGFFTNNYLGRKYEYQNNSENQPYFVPDYTRTKEQYPVYDDVTGQLIYNASRTLTETNPYSAMEDYLYGGNWDNRDFRSNSFQDALFLSLAGITPVGKKASFIFDALAVVNRKESVKYYDHNVDLTYDSTVYYYAVDNNTSQPSATQVFDVNRNFTIQKGELEKRGDYTVTLVLMPSMRFNRSYNQAFQVSLSGIIRFDQYGAAAVPTPMISWLRKF